MRDAAGLSKSVAESRLELDVKGALLLRIAQTAQMREPAEKPLGDNEGVTNANADE